MDLLGLFPYIHTHTTYHYVCIHIYITYIYIIIYDNICILYSSYVHSVDIYSQWLSPPRNPSDGARSDASMRSTPAAMPPKPWRRGILSVVFSSFHRDFSHQTMAYIRWYKWITVDITDKSDGWCLVRGGYYPIYWYILGIITLHERGDPVHNQQV